MSRHVGIIGLPEFTYESSIVLNMAALRCITFEDSLCVQQKEAISNIVVLDTDHFTASVIFTFGSIFYCSQANQ